MIIDIRKISFLFFFFFFNDTATTEIYTLSLHDALPIFRPDRLPQFIANDIDAGGLCSSLDGNAQHDERSEEHTSELQSRSDLVCRLLLEKKKKENNILETLCRSLPCMSLRYSEIGACFY